MKYIIVLLACAPLLAANHFVSQSGGTFSGGSACNGQTAESIATFNAATPSPGEVDTICGTITTTLQINASGTSGSLIEIKADTGASIQVGGASGATIALNGYTYLLFDGGIACGPGVAMSGCGQLAIANNGSPQGGFATNDLASLFSGNCTANGTIEIRNWQLGPVYQHTSLSDQTANIDTETNVIVANNSTGQACSLSVHDNTIHDVGVAFLLENFSNSPTVQIFNNYVYNMDWALGLTPQSTTSPYSLLFHDNHIGSTTNWDTTADSFHHDGIHNFGRTDLATLYEVYNNLFDGAWGTCCATAFIYTEFTPLANYYQFNNVFNQAEAGDSFPLVELSVATGGIYNDTYLSSSGANNVVCLNPSDITGVVSTGLTIANLAMQGCGNFIQTNGPPYWISSNTDYNYNYYMAVGASGNPAWGGSNPPISNWQSACSCDSMSAYSATGYLNSNGTPQPTFPGLSTGTNPGGNLTSLCGTVAALCSSSTAGNSVAAVARPSTGAWTIGAYNYIPPPGSISSSTGIASSSGVQ